MEEAKEVKIRKTATKNIASIAAYIANKGYPATAVEFADQLYEYALSLGLFPGKYPICRHKFLAKRDLHCAVFSKSFVFIYKIKKKVVEVYNVVHASSIS